jgi:hypothetical protein
MCSLHFLRKYTGRNRTHAKSTVPYWGHTCLWMTACSGFLRLWEPRVLRGERRIRGVRRGGEGGEKPCGFLCPRGQGRNYASGVRPKLSWRRGWTDRTEPWAPVGFPPRPGSRVAVCPVVLLLGFPTLGFL